MCSFSYVDGGAVLDGVTVKGEEGRTPETVQHNTSTRSDLG